MTNSVFPNVAIVGIGLIGSSIAHAIKERLSDVSVTLFDQSEDVRARAGQLAIGRVADTLTDAVSGADLVILCTPVGAMGAVAEAMVPSLKPGAVITDVGSVKASVSALKSALPQQVYFVPGHPIAGTEKSGPEAGFGSLFLDRWCILTPDSSRMEDAGYKTASEDLGSFWTGIGSRVEIMTPEHHDRVLAITSHLPHLIAFNIVSTASDLETVTESDVVKFSAGGFRDFTRIAASDPTMWRDVFLNNKEAVLEMLGRFSEDLTALQRAIRWGDGDMLHEQFERARNIRQSVIDAGQDTAEVNFGRD